MHIVLSLFIWLLGYDQFLNFTINGFRDNLFGYKLVFLSIGTAINSFANASPIPGRALSCASVAVFISSSSALSALACSTFFVASAGTAGIEGVATFQQPRTGKRQTSGRIQER
jgi:hypothetical protein